MHKADERIVAVTYIVTHFCNWRADRERIQASTVKQAGERREGDQGDHAASSNGMRGCVVVSCRH